MFASTSNFQPPPDFPQVLAELIVRICILYASETRVESRKFFRKNFGNSGKNGYKNKIGKIKNLQAMKKKNLGKISGNFSKKNSTLDFRWDDIVEPLKFFIFWTFLDPWDHQRLMGLLYKSR